MVVVLNCSTQVLHIYKMFQDLVIIVCQEFHFYVRIPMNKIVAVESIDSCDIWHKNNQNKCFLILYKPVQV